jgi:glyoxylase-like metal-dependent hydrolase (beta-lactamase superfamily II)
MNRKSVIKISTLVCGVLFILSLMSNKDFNKAKMENKTMVKPLEIHLGKIKILIFSDGQLAFDKAQPTFAPTIPRAEFEAESETLHLRKEGVDLGNNVMLIQSSEKIILIDAGMGKHFGDSQGKLLEHLVNAGIPPNSITDILITHAHRDHIGGLVTKDGAIIYPNAKYHIAKEEYDFWMSENPDFSHSKLTAEQIKVTIGFTKNILNKIKKNVVLFSPGETLFSIIQTDLAVGHTPGHTVFTITSEGKSIKNIVDVFHTTLMISEPEWGVSLDVNFEEGIKTRTTILEECSTQKTLVMSSHLPWPGLGYIDKKEKYSWSPLNYYNPYEIEL